MLRSSRRGGVGKATPRSGASAVRSAWASTAGVNAPSGAQSRLRSSRRGRVRKATPRSGASAVRSAWASTAGVNAPSGVPARQPWL